MVEAYNYISKTFKAPVASSVRVIPIQSRFVGPLRDRDILSAGVSQRRKPLEIKRPKTDYHLLLFVFNGRARLNYDGDIQVMEPNQFWVIPGHRPYKWILECDYWETMWFHLADRGSWKKINEKGAHTIDAGWPARTRWAMETIFRESYVHKFKDSPQMIHASAETIGIYLDRRMGILSGGQEQVLRNRLLTLWDMVNADLARVWSVKALAKELSISEIQLHRYTATCHGTTPMKMVTRLRMDHAKQLLLSTDYPIKFIAACVGYETPFSFSKAFKRETGNNPKLFRKGNA